MLVMRRGTEVSLRTDIKKFSKRPEESEGPEHTRAVLLNNVQAKQLVTSFQEATEHTPERKITNSHELHPARNVLDK